MWVSTSDITAAGGLSPADLARGIAKGYWQVVGRTRLEGQPAIELSETGRGPGVYAPLPTLLWVNARTHLPIRMVNGVGHAQWDVNEWGFLPPTAANLARLRCPSPPGTRAPSRRAERLGRIGAAALLLGRDLGTGPPAGPRPSPGGHARVPVMAPWAGTRSRGAGMGVSMDLELRGSRALITGGSRGIGFAVADALAAEGVAVGLVARDAGGLAAASGRLAARGTPVATAAADVTGRGRAEPGGRRRSRPRWAVSTCSSPTRAAPSARGNLNSAGPGEFTATFALNAGHAAELIRAGLPHLRQAGGGAVVIVSSITGLRPAPRTAYAAAKAAEIQLAATAAQELAPDRSG